MLRKSGSFDLLDHQATRPPETVFSTTIGEAGCSATNQTIAAVADIPSLGESGSTNNQVVL